MEKHLFYIIDVFAEALMKNGVDREKVRDCLIEIDAEIRHVQYEMEREWIIKRGPVIDKKPNILKSGKHDESFCKDMWDSLLKEGKGNR